MICVLILPNKLQSQYIEVDANSKSLVGLSKSLVGVAFTEQNNNSNYGKGNFGIDIFFRHNFKFMIDTNSYYCINANYINYKNDSIIKNDYSVSLGFLHTHKIIDIMYSMSYCFGLDFGVLYKDNGLYYGTVSFNNGFIIGINRFNIEAIIKTKYNPSDDIHVGAMVGLSYSF